MSEEKISNGKKFLEIVESHDINMSELADVMGYNRTTLYKLSKRQGDINKGKLQKARAYMLKNHNYDIRKDFPELPEAIDLLQEDSTDYKVSSVFESAEVQRLKTELKKIKTERDNFELMYYQSVQRENNLLRNVDSANTTLMSFIENQSKLTIKMIEKIK